MIPIILTLYKRPQYLEKQLEMFKNQTCVDDIELNIISNNLNIDFENIINQYKKFLNIKFVKCDNTLFSFERHFYAYKNKFEYVIIIDDDIFIDNTSIEKIWQQREKNTLKGHWLRKFNEQKFLTDGKPYTTESLDDQKDKLYNYVGGNLCLIDCNIYKIVIDYFEKYQDLIYKKYNIKIERIDDIFVSWVANVFNYKIKSFNIKPTEFYGNDEVAMYKEEWSKKDSLVKILHKIKPWKFYQ